MSSRIGSARFMLIGTWLDEAVVTAIVSPPGSDACDIVSVRRASLKERIANEQV